MAEGYAKNIAAIRAAGGIPQVNHPNYRWSVRLGDVVNLPDSTLFEIANAHTLVNNPGSADADGRVVPSTEALWRRYVARRHSGAGARRVAPYRPWRGRNGVERSTQWVDAAGVLARLPYVRHLRQIQR